MLTAKEIRRLFLDYFVRNGHTEATSGPLVPRDDPSLLFSNAGMVQFKKLFLGEEKRDYVRATTSQKCLRVSGKHNDLENVGRTARHHTFFEMLGNFSFGDYFKEDAIRMAWGFVTEELKLPKDKLYVTIYWDDDEAFDLWQQVAHVSPDRIIRLGEKDNFWSMGDSGPCGPCSEIHIDQGEDMRCGPQCGIGACDCDRFLEIWNLVFMQYDQPADGGPRQPLPRPSIDTGMGLERIAAICQGKRSNYDSDLFQAIIQYAAELAGVQYSFSLPDTNDTDTALRVIADHARSAAFLIADGVLPSNEGRGYVLRRLIRRALRFATLMGVQEAFLYRVALKVVEVMGEQYSELVERSSFLSRAVREEEERFSLTLGKGLVMLEEELVALEGKGERQVPGPLAFTLYDTFGFPLDIINDVAEKRGFSVDEVGFATLMQEQKSRSRAAQKGGGLLGKSGEAPGFASLLEDGLRTEFFGYSHYVLTDRIVAMLDSDAVPTDSLALGAEGYVITSRTPFYGASGGQVGDRGLVETPAGTAVVMNTLKPSPDLTVHQVRVTEGTILPDQEVVLRVTEAERLAVARNHTGTHLVHAALRRVLGDHVKQAGSLVTPERLRFDFTHIAAMTPEEVAAVEAEVNRMILSDFPVNTAEMSQNEAVAAGAMALFGEKYGDVVRVVRVGLDDCPAESMELCGGTHLQRTGQAGMFSIVSESGVAAGVRRIEAVTGWSALQLARESCAELDRLSGMLKSRPGELVEKVEALQKEAKALRKELERAAAQATSSQGRNLMDGLEEVNGVKLLVARMDNTPIKTLREVMDDVRSKLESGVALLASQEGEKITLILYVSKDLHPRFTAPGLIMDVAAPVGGSGGGRPDQAQAGGINPAGYDEAVSALRKALNG